MFAYVSGTLVSKEPAAAVIDCHGVGFMLSTTYNTFRLLPEPGGNATLHTYYYVREDIRELMGFAQKEELESFRLLITVSGVGPKAALAILSEVTPARLALAIVNGDTKALTKAQGVGPKLAQRILLELKDKVKKDQQASSGGWEDLVTETPAGNAEEAVRALVVLGYSQQQAKDAVSRVAGDGLSVEELIRDALKSLF